MLNLEKKFSSKKGQLRVADFLLRNGIRISRDGRLLVNEVELSHVSIAKIAGVDRRIIKSTINSILKDKKLTAVFTKLSSTPLLRDVAPELGFGAIEIIPTDAASKGIVASITGIITDSGISIRQVLAEDPMFRNAQLTIVTEKPIPRELIDKMLQVKGVKKVIIIS